MFKRLISLMHRSVFYDDFNYNSLSSKWTITFTANTGTIAEQNQEIETTGLNQAFIRSVNAFDMTGRFTSIQIVTPPAANANYNQDIFWSSNDRSNLAAGNYYAADVYNGNTRIL